jgi:hypothetical protein
MGAGQTPTRTDLLGAGLVIVGTSVIVGLARDGGYGYPFY